MPENTTPVSGTGDAFEVFDRPQPVPPAPINVQYNLPNTSGFSTWTGNAGTTASEWLSAIGKSSSNYTISVRRSNATGGRDMINNALDSFVLAEGDQIIVQPRKVAGADPTTDGDANADEAVLASNA